MAKQDPRSITGLLDDWNRCDEEALNRLVSLLYPELRRIAKQCLEHRPASHTLDSAALVNEA